MSKKILLLPLALLVLASCKPTVSSSEKLNYNETILNGSFEDGLTGWTAKGLGAFSEDDVKTVDYLEDGQFSRKVGDAFYAGATSSLPSFTGTLESEPFKLQGIGIISFKVGAGKDPSKSYIEFVNAQTNTVLTFYQNESDEEVSKFTNKDFNNTTITSQLLRNYVDLSAHLEEIMYIRVVDNDAGSDYADYSFWNLDDFRVLGNAQEKNDILTERVEDLLEFFEDDIDAETPVEALRNGSFETGDTTYWRSLSGKAFYGEIIRSASETYWDEREFYASGDYFLSGFWDESQVGKMRSEKFVVKDMGEGSSYVSFKLGAAKQHDVYVALNNGLTGSELKAIRNTGFSDPGLAQTLITYIVDVSDLIGETLYFTLVDNATSGGFAAMVADDFVINLSKDDAMQKVSDIRTFAETAEDLLARADFLKLYNGGMSFPLAGNAPTIEESDDYAFSRTMQKTTVSLHSMLVNNAKFSDDYTATKDLSITISEVTLDGSVVNEPNVNEFSLSEGEYEVTFSVGDAYGQSATSKFKITATSELSYDSEVTNGGFETGDLDGWTVSYGNVNVNKAINDATIFWDEGIPFNKSGTYFFNGWEANQNESEGYALRSSTFTLGGSGQISFKMGGRSAAVKVYNEGGVLLATYRNYMFNDNGELFPYVKNGSRLATMTTFVADLTAHIGENLYIELVDEEVDANWGVVFFDDIKTYYDDYLDISEHADTVSQFGESFQIPYAEAHNN